MEFLCHIQLASLTCLVFLLVYKVRIIRNRGRRRESHENRKPPKPQGARPIIGHLHLLAGKDDRPPHRTLGAIADEHGPAFEIQLGTKRAVVVSSWEFVKECFTTNDKVFLTRPTSAASTYMGYGTALFGLGPYGPYWREIRKVTTLELLSLHRLDLLTHVRASELDTCIKHLYSLCLNNNNNNITTTTKVDMGEWFSCVTMNTMVRLIAGKRYGGADDGSDKNFRKAIEDFMYLSGVFVPSDFIPYIEWLDLLGYLSSMKRNAKELDKIMSRWLEDHNLQKRRSDGLDQEVDHDQRDFIDAMVSLFGDGVGLIHGHKTETVIKATALNLIVAAVDSTSVTLTWALSLLLNHVPVLKRVQEEIDFHVGRERWVEESDTKNLVYLQAIIKETLRLYPAGPLSAPRQAMEDCCLNGYYVPKGTILLVNIWKLHRDPRIWVDPNEFKPERFLADHAQVDVRGRKFEYIPFSSGRRSCPGISSAMRTISLSLGRLLQGFNMSTPRDEAVDMSEGLGMTMPKATPLDVILSPRLSACLYP